MQNNNKNGLLDYLKRITSWSMLVSIMTFASCIISFCIYFGNTLTGTKSVEQEISELKDSISNNVLKIQSTFNTESLPTSSPQDSTLYDIIKFEESTVMLVHVWESYNTLPSFETLKPNSLDEAFKMIQHYTQTEIKLNEAQQTVLSNIHKVLSNGKNEKNIAVVSSATKLFAFQNQYIEWMGIFDDHQEKVLLGIREINANKDTKPDEFMEALKPYDDIRKDKRFYRCINTLFSYCIELKQACDSTYNIH